MEDLTLEQLRKERDKLIRSLRDYEKHETERNEIGIHPSPSVVYHCENLYLMETIKLILEKTLPTD
jgi:hypothetical protein